MTWRVKNTNAPITPNWTKTSRKLRIRDLDLSSDGVILSRNKDTRKAITKQTDPTHALPAVRITGSILIFTHKIVMPDLKDFMEWEWDEYLCVHVTLKVKSYIPTDIEELEDVIQDMRIKSRSMIIRVDLKGANPFCHEVRQITKLILEVFEYTKNDELLKEIQFINAGFLVRSFYRPISMMLPSYVREIIVFS
jgi:hypothetical protein